ncbi:MAG TPA: hypothetical protein VHP14_01110, partial [Anaerolineales bacterium]|nr:hypothetical protein [Anaerolineales bacterium]
FEVAHVPADNLAIETEGGLAEALHQAVIDPSRARLKAVYVGPKPDLLRNEAQAIMTDHPGLLQYKAPRKQPSQKLIFSWITCKKF